LLQVAARISDLIVGHIDHHLVQGACEGKGRFELTHRGLACTAYANAAAARSTKDLRHMDLAALLAVDPVGLGGVALRAPACAERDVWLALLRDLLPRDTPLRRVPLNISDTALLGGLDLGATLQAGRPVALQGLLAQADGGVLLLA
jgi:magnesium chelatase subunit D